LRPHPNKKHLMLSKSGRGLHHQPPKPAHDKLQIYSEHLKLACAKTWKTQLLAIWGFSSRTILQLNHEHACNTMHAENGFGTPLYSPPPDHDQYSDLGHRCQEPDPNNCIASASSSSARSAGAARPQGPKSSSEQEGSHAAFAMPGVPRSSSEELILSAELPTCRIGNVSET
jgi:hypothetical protein